MSEIKSITLPNTRSYEIGDIIERHIITSFDLLWEPICVINVYGRHHDWEEEKAKCIAQIVNETIVWYI